MGYYCIECQFLDKSEKRDGKCKCVKHGCYVSIGDYCWSFKKED